MFDFQSLHFTDSHIFCYWYRTKVRITFATLPVGVAQIVFPPFPQFQCCLFLRAMGAGIFQTEVRTSKHAHCTTLKLGAGGGGMVNSFCFFPFRHVSFVRESFWGGANFCLLPVWFKVFFSFVGAISRCFAMDAFLVFGPFATIVHGVSSRILAISVIGT